MAHYQIEENLRTTNGQRAVSWVIALIASAIILLMLYFVHISIPNPPFENKKGDLILDFGMVEDPSFLPMVAHLQLHQNWAVIHLKDPNPINHKAVARDQ